MNKGLIYRQPTTKQAGQALPLGLALLAFGIFISISLFNTGQNTSEKMRLTNAADAAAYSGLVWQARAMNFQSYTNRAMVANQVSIAQAVSLRSWSRYGVIATENVNTVLGGLPFVGAVTQAMAATMASASRVIEPVTEALLSVVDGFNGVVSQAQEAMFVTSFVATPEIVREIAKQNGPAYKVESAYALGGLGQNLHDWNAMTSSYATDDHNAMQRRADLINESRDQFSQRRDWEFFDSFWFYSTPLTKHKIFRRGDTRLVRNDADEEGAAQWEWKAKDSISLQNKIHTWRGTKRREMPIGWAQAYANNQGANDDSIEPCETDHRELAPGVAEGCPRWLGYNRRAERLSDMGVVSPARGTQSQIHMDATYHGIRVYRDLAALPDQAKDPRLGLRVEVHTSADSLSNSDDIIKKEPFNAELRYASAEMAAIASGEVYYRRPELDAGSVVTEYANGYNPFWDVRLAAISDEEKIAAMLLRAPDLLSGSTTPEREGTGDNAGEHSNEHSGDQSDAVDDGNSAESATIVNEEADIQVSESGSELSVYTENDSEHDSTRPTTSSNPESAGIDRQFPIAATDAELNLGDARGYLDTYSAQQLSTDHMEAVLSDAFEDTMEEGVRTIVEGAIAGQFGQNIQAHAQSASDLYSTVNNTLDELSEAGEALENNLRNELQAALDLSNQVRQEFERIKDAVASEFEAGLAELGETLQAELSEFQSEIDDIEEQLLDAVDPVLIAELTSQVDDLQTQLLEVGGSQLDRQAQLLIDIVESHTDAIVLDIETARRIVLMSLENETGEDPLAGFLEQDDRSNGDEFSDGS